MWGAFSRKDFETIPELIECKAFMKKVEKKLHRKRKYNAKKFEEVKKIITTQLKMDSAEQNSERNGIIETRTSYIHQDNPFIEALNVTEKDNRLGELISDKLYLFSGNSDAYDITVAKTASGRFWYEID